jgi:trigger factor
VVKSEIKSINSVRKEAVVVVEKDVVQNEENLILQSFGHDVKVPGFRKGRVPSTLIKARYAKELDAQVNKALASKIFNDVVEENQWNLFSLAKFNVENVADGCKTFTFVIDLRPTFEPLDYKNIAIEQPAITVSDDEVLAMIEQIRHHHADYRNVERPIQQGDFVRLNYEGYFENGQKVSELLPSQGILGGQDSTWQEIGAESEYNGENDIFFHIDAVVDGLVAMKVDQEKTVTVVFPDTFSIPELQNKKVFYNIKVLEVREKVPPELDDAFFKKLNVESLEDLKARVLRDLQYQKLQQVRLEQRENIVQKMIESADFEVPETAVEYEHIQVMRNFLEQQIYKGATMEMLKSEGEDLYEETLELSKDRAKINFILEVIAHKENITITEKDMEQMIIQEASLLGITPDQLIAQLKKDKDRMQELQRRARFGKTLDFILLYNLKKNSPEIVNPLAEEPAPSAIASDASLPSQSQEGQPE